MTKTIKLQPPRIYFDPAGIDPSFLELLPSYRFAPARRTGSCLETPVAASMLLDRGVRPVASTHSLTELAARCKPIRPLEQSSTDLPEGFVGTEPWAHQCWLYNEARERSFVLINFYMGRGKTKSAIDLANIWGCKKILVIAPLAVVKVWPYQIDLYDPTGRATLLLDDRYSVKKKRDLAAGFLGDRESGWVVVNYDSAKLAPFADWSMAAGFDAVILDESHAIKSADSDVGKYCRKLGRFVPYRMALTGTSMSELPLDLWGQFGFLDPAILGSSFTTFKYQHAIFDSSSGHPAIIGWQNLDRLAAKVAPHIVYVGPDYDNLPQQINSRVDIDLPEDARQTYAMLRENLVLEVSRLPDRVKAMLETDASDDEFIAQCPNVLVKLLKLQQLTSGFVTTADKQPIYLHHAKREALYEDLRGLPMSEPAIVFYRFTPDAEQIEQVAQRLGRNYGEVSGRRKDLAAGGKLPKGIDLLACQVSSGSQGVDLTSAAAQWYYSTGFSNAQYLQSRSRIWRPGQSRPCNFRHLVCTATVDDYILRAIARKQAVIKTVVKLLQAEAA